MAGVGQEGTGQGTDGILAFRQGLEQRQGAIQPTELKAHIPLDQAKPRRSPQCWLNEIEPRLGIEQGMGGSQPLRFAKQGLGIGRCGGKAGLRCRLAGAGHGIDGHTAQRRDRHAA